MDADTLAAMVERMTKEPLRARDDDFGVMTNADLAAIAALVNAAPVLIAALRLAEADNDGDEGLLYAARVAYDRALAEAQS